MDVLDQLTLTALLALASERQFRKSAHRMPISLPTNGWDIKRSKKTHKHSSVNHSKGEYVRWEDGVCVSTNSVEGFFSILKRGVNGTYHHVSKQHLHRYLSEFDFRFNARKMTDSERREAALQGFNGKRLMLHDPVGKSEKPN
jgi:hypothetical protein